MRRLRAAWSTPVPGDTSLESTPLVVDGVMYGTSGGNPRTVTALDARTGRQIWRFTRPQKVRNPGETNPSTAAWRSSATGCSSARYDAALVCLDARTGLLLWEVAGRRHDGRLQHHQPAAHRQGQGHRRASPAANSALRGFLDAYDAATGKRLWRFYTIPAPGEFGNDTWKGRQLEDRRRRRRG